ncbi:MAG: PHP domain-containing protein [Methylovulum sp.]|uniref:PHP domain-containing protein n=1 Tax=Methylovulum sp. TaxID=1916980 RepID=UPI00260F35CA|nr:PHP domain-containing protein [Methylovulum sp.]MDD2724693.1 PHP domain-containing protein [Methylovulum sp.]MDD5124998.1 PHP domain-containing protein [Methylovulum sp.]
MPEPSSPDPGKPEIYDLHCHSTASDGSLSPTAVVQRAFERGVTALALTDHDTTAGLAEARLCATAAGIKLIPGIELSAQWQKQCFHIVGLGIDPDYAPLAEATHLLQGTRMCRAEKIAEKLAQKHIPGALEAVMKAAGDGMVTRSHFADFLVAGHHVDSQQDAFDRYLAKGKPAYVATPWAELAQAVAWIIESGGVAVLAHPLRYNLTANKMKKLLAVFKEAGGQGMEIVTGRISPDEIRRAAHFAKSFGLSGSMGSDFHSPDQWVELGRLAALPTGIQPVWELLD